MNSSGNIIRTKGSLRSEAKPETELCVVEGLRHDGDHGR